MFDAEQVFQDFEDGMQAGADPVQAIANAVIGKDMTIDRGYGPKPLIYADYVASGRALRQVEDFVATQVLPYHANSHTVDSFCGEVITGLRETARARITRSLGAGPDHAVIFAGSGATTGLNMLVHLFGLRAALDAGRRVVVLHGPYEHHSNLLPWRESGAEVIALPEAASGGVDLDALQAALAACGPKDLIVGTFSAAANVTGVCSEIGPVTQMIRAAGGRVVWDYAGGGPYLPITMTLPCGTALDAVVLSPHKFVGGAGASGLLVVRRDAVAASVPSRPGGGTVRFVNATTHDYVARLEQREEGGTPNVIGDIRAALALIVKDVVGQSFITARNTELTTRAFAAWADDAHIGLLAPDRSARLPILSFVPKDAHGQPYCYRAFTRALSDRYGIQARGGCSCAGPYVHDLLSIDAGRSAVIRDDILQGNGREKPGFVRLNLSFLIDDAEADFILSAVQELARTGLDSEASRDAA